MIVGVELCWPVTVADGGTLVAVGFRVFVEVGETVGVGAVGVEVGEGDLVIVGLEV